MTVFLIISLVIILIFIVLFFHRDRLYMRKELRDVLSDEMKQEINMRTEEEHPFEENLNVVSQKQSATKQFLNEWDDITE